MKCVICKHGVIKQGITSKLFEKDNSPIVIKGLIDICDNFNELYSPDMKAKKE